VFTKLGVTSRTDLAAVGDQIGLAAGVGEVPPGSDAVAAGLGPPAAVPGTRGQLGTSLIQCGLTPAYVACAGLVNASGRAKKGGLPWIARLPRHRLSVDPRRRRSR
jgi:hypothetical protein